MANQLSGTIVANGLGFVKATLDGIEFDKIKTYSVLTDAKDVTLKEE